MSQIKPAVVLPQRLLSNARILAERADILPLLPKDAVIVEVGVAMGDFSTKFLEICQPKLFIAIDIFTMHEYPTIWGRSREEVFGTRTHAELYRDKYAAEIAAGRVRVMHEDSQAALERLDDASVDVVYLDAEHSYASVSRELAIIARKIRPDGWIVLNDYIMNDVDNSFSPYGVIQAVHQFMVREDWEMAYLALHPYMYCDVALRKAR